MTDVEKLIERLDSWDVSAGIKDYESKLGDMLTEAAAMLRSLGEELDDTLKNLRGEGVLRAQYEAEIASLRAKLHTATMTLRLFAHAENYQGGASGRWVELRGRECAVWTLEEIKSRSQPDK